MRIAALAKGISRKQRRAPIEDSHWLNTVAEASQELLSKVEKSFSHNLSSLGSTRKPVPVLKNGLRVLSRRQKEATHHAQD